MKLEITVKEGAEKGLEGQRAAMLYLNIDDHLHL